MFPNLFFMTNFYMIYELNLLIVHLLPDGINPLTAIGKNKYRITNDQFYSPCKIHDPSYTHTTIYINSLYLSDSIKK